MRDWASQKGCRLRIARNRTSRRLSKIRNIGSGRARKLLKEHSREERDISVRDWAREKGFHLGIARVVDLDKIKNIGSGRA